MAWGGFPRARVQEVSSLILVDALFSLDGGRRREEKKKKSPPTKIAMWDKGFPRAVPP
jgi:hypothetical protein